MMDNFLLSVRFKENSRLLVAFHVVESVIRFITIKYSLFLGETRMSSADKGTEFERTVCEILYQTNPYSISHYIGG